MSQTANGRITGTAGTRFTATFVTADTGIHVHYLGDFSSSVQAFVSSNATLRYDNASQLAATRLQFHGQLGEKTVKLNMVNGPTIEGVLDMPVSPASSVSGSGVWAIN